jgi:hypothetical protein
MPVGGATANPVSPSPADRWRVLFQSPVRRRRAVRTTSNALGGGRSDARQRLVGFKPSGDRREAPRLKASGLQRSGGECSVEIAVALVERLDMDDWPRLTEGLSHSQQYMIDRDRDELHQV